MNRVILHFDFDCFYASCFEKHDPKLKTLPLAVQQKQIVVTCNYIARSKGLKKLGLVSDAKKQCPDVVIVNGEDLTLFRDESKENYLFLAKYAWGQTKRVERLGLDEVFMDASEVVEFNIKEWKNGVPKSPFFRLSPTDPDAGFAFDLKTIPNHVYPPLNNSLIAEENSNDELSCTISDIPLPMLLGAHLASYLRGLLVTERGFTCSAGICDTKLSSKLAGNLRKPDDQTLLLPRYTQDFLDTHEIGKLSGIGFKTASVIREAYFKSRDNAEGAGQTVKEGDEEEYLDDVLVQEEDFKDAQPSEENDNAINNATSTESKETEKGQDQLEVNYYGQVKRSIRVSDARNSMTANNLELLLGNFIGRRVWELLHGIDKTPVAIARTVPTQISIEDTFRASTMTNLPDVEKALVRICQSLIRRMRVDLLQKPESSGTKEKWICFPRTLRVSSRDRIVQPKYGPRSSKSCPMPNFVFSLNSTAEAISARLVKEAALPLFKRINSSGKWDLALLNVCAANMADGETGNSGGNIGEMLKRYGEVFPDSIKKRSLKVPEANSPVAAAPKEQSNYEEELDDGLLSDDNEDNWQAGLESGAGDSGNFVVCKICGIGLPLFAIGAHERFHKLGDG